MENLNIWKGLLVTFMVITLWKFMRFWFRNTNRKDPDLKFWLANNWGDYPIHLGITWMFFFFEQDVLAVLNPLLIKLGTTWQIPHPENKGFLFILVPMVVSIVLYPILRKYFAKPTQQAISPTIHKKFHD
nr:hypothetical protein [uncultured Allomuricauda sp.]